MTRQRLARGDRVLGFLLYVAVVASVTFVVYVTASWALAVPVEGR